MTSWMTHSLLSLLYLLESGCQFLERLSFSNSSSRGANGSCSNSGYLEKNWLGGIFVLIFLPKAWYDAVGYNRVGTFRFDVRAEALVWNIGRMMA